MKKTLVLLLAIVVTILSGCHTETIEDAKALSIEKDFELKSIANYSIRIPSYMTSSTTLNPDASLQYMDAIKEEYIVVIDESKAVFIDALKEYGEYRLNEQDLIAYRNAQFSFTEQQIDIKNRSDFKSISVKGINIECVELDAKLEELDELVSYFFYYVDGGNELYTIMAWTLQSKKDLYREKVKKMIQTFTVKNTTKADK